MQRIGNFNELLHHFLHKHKKIILTGVIPRSREELLRYGIVDLIGKENIFSLFDDAVKRC